MSRECGGVWCTCKACVAVHKLDCGIECTVERAGRVAVRLCGKAPGLAASLEVNLARCTAPHEHGLVCQHRSHVGRSADVLLSVVLPTKAVAAAHCVHGGCKQEGQHGENEELHTVCVLFVL